MKTLNDILLAVLVLGLIIAFSGCGKSEPEKFGEKVSKGEATELKEVLKDPEAFSGKSVIIKGKIVRECNTGCWFDVAGDGGTIHVDINPSGFAIPQKVGKEVTVEGDVSVRDGQITFIGKGVEIK